MSSIALGWRGLTFGISGRRELALISPQTAPPPLRCIPWLLPVVVRQTTFRSGSVSHRVRLPLTPTDFPFRHPTLHEVQPVRVHRSTWRLPECRRRSCVRRMSNSEEPGLFEFHPFAFRAVRIRCQHNNRGHQRESNMVLVPATQIPNDLCFACSDIGTPRRRLGQPYGQYRLGRPKS